MVVSSTARRLPPGQRAVYLDEGGSLCEAKESHNLTI